MTLAHQPSMWDIAEEPTLGPLAGSVLRHELSDGAWVDLYAFTLEPQLASLRPRLQSVRREVHEMTEAVRHVAAALAHAFAPRVVIQALWQVHVRTTATDAIVGDARKIGLAADPGAIAAVEGVIPDVQLGDERCIHR